VIDLQHGDVLLYSGTRATDWLIRAKSWSRISHCEAVSINRSAVASRIPHGVDRYGIYLDGLKYIMRPLIAFDAPKAEAYFRSVRGWAYDYIGLFGFFNADWQGQQNRAMFCSEFATNYLRAGGVDPFNGYAADGIAPGEFLKSIVFRTYEV
jgi:hypothetical protein